MGPAKVVPSASRFPRTAIPGPGAAKGPQVEVDHREAVVLRGMLSGMWSIGGVFDRSSHDGPPRLR